MFTVWLLSVIINTKYISLAPVYPEFTQKASCERFLADLKAEAHKATVDTDVNGNYVEIQK
jgi:hypothetical protein